MTPAPNSFVEMYGARLANALWIAMQSTRVGKCYRCSQPGIVNLILSVSARPSGPGVRLGGGIVAAGICAACAKDAKLDDASAMQGATLVME